MYQVCHVLESSSSRAGDAQQKPEVLCVGHRQDQEKACYKGTLSEGHLKSLYDVLPSVKAEGITAYRVYLGADGGQQPPLSEGEMQGITLGLTSKHGQTPPCSATLLPPF